jgi:hypothetical protein
MSELPKVSEPKELLLERLRPYLPDMRKDLSEPYFMLEYNGVPFSPLSGIQAITGKQKNGKTFVLTQLMAAILDDGSGRVRDYLPGLKVPDRTIEYLGRLPKVLFVDTEMEELNNMRVLRRVHWLCGWDMRENNERFSKLWLRTMPEDVDENGKVTLPVCTKRMNAIMDAIELFEPDVVFVDGVRDIVGDFNDNSESAELINKLMRVAQEKNICIWNALHQNPGGDGDGKMRGHLGTELANKVSDTFCSVKNKKNGLINFTVKQLDARGKDVDDWTYEIDDNDIKMGIPKIIHVAEPVADDTLSPIVVKALKDALPNGKSLKYSEIRKQLMETVGVTKNGAQKLIKLARDNGVLLTNDIAGGQVFSFNHKDLQNNEELPF